MPKKPTKPTPLAPHEGLKYPLIMPAATALKNIDPKLPIADFDKVRTAMALLSASRGPALTWSGWLIIGEALAIGERHALKAGKGATTSRGGYGTTIAEFLRKTGFTFLNKGVRWALRECLSRRADIDEWRDSLAADRRQHLNNPIDVLDAFKREWNAADTEKRRSAAANKKAKEHPSLLEEFVALAGHLEAVEEQRDMLESLLKIVAGAATVKSLDGFPDNVLRQIFPHLADAVQDALHARLFPEVRE